MDKEAIKREYCTGCREDIYNHPDENPSGTSECWLLENAEVVRRKEVHVDQRPPWTGDSVRMVNVPHCYHRPRHIYVDPEQEY